MAMLEREQKSKHVHDLTNAPFWGRLGCTVVAVPSFGLLDWSFFFDRSMPNGLRRGLLAAVTRGFESELRVEPM